MNVSSAVPATSIAPTITIPWIALVPDISGVCSIVGTFEITSKPRKTASTRIVSSITNGVMRAPLRQAISRRPRPGPRDARAGGDLVVEVERQLAAGARCCSSAITLRAYRRLASDAISDGRFVEADDRHALADDLLARAA